MPETPKPLRIFLSYAHADVASARKLHRYLREKGFDVWFDKENLVPGQDWQLEIERGLNRSDVILICLSQNTVRQEGYVQREFKFALERALEMPEGRVFLIPVRLQPCEAPTRLNRYQWVDLFEREGYSRLLLGLKQCAEQLQSARVNESQPISIPNPDSLNDTSASISDNARGNTIIIGDGNVIHSVGDAERQRNDSIEKNTAEQSEAERIAKQKTNDPLWVDAIMPKVASDFLARHPLLGRWIILLMVFALTLSLVLTARSDVLEKLSMLPVTMFNGSPVLKTVNLVITGIYPDSDQFLVGNKITVSVGVSSSDPSGVGRPFSTGNITVTDGVSTCQITLPALSCDLVFKTAGGKQLWASYGGDTIYSQGRSPKYPLNQKIYIFSPTVKLTPNFYLTAAKDSPIVVTNQQFKMDQKLYVEITVTPLNAVLLDDGKSKVSLSICKQSDYPASCSVPIATVVDVTGGVGTANILIPGFPGAGIYILRFDYRHDDSLLTPASYQKRDVKVSKLGIYLTLPPSPLCSDFIPAGATCSFGYADPQKAHIMWDIHQTVGNDYLDESMPKPILILNKTIIWKVYETSPGKPFACEVKTKSVVQPSSIRQVYVLDCIANVLGKARLLVNYAYNNTMAPDYFMGDDPLKFPTKSFFLQPADQTAIEFNASDYWVGQIISLTPNANLRLLSAATRTTITNVAGKITFSSNPQIAGLFGVVPSSTCSANTAGDAIVNIDVDEKCQIFFQKAGAWNVQINFSGDDNNAVSSASVSGINVKKQDQITMTVDGLSKVFVTSKVSQPFNTTMPAGSPTQTVTMTLTNPDTTTLPLTDNNLASWFDVAYPSCMSLAGTITSNTTVEWTMTPASSYPCVGTLSIYYKENTYFGRRLLVSQPVQFAKPPAPATPTSAP